MFDSTSCITMYIEVHCFLSQTQEIESSKFKVQSVSLKFERLQFLLCNSNTDDYD